MKNINKTIYDEKASGLAYSIVILLSFFVSFIFSIALIVAGVDVSDWAQNGYPDGVLYLMFLLPQFSFFAVVIGFFVKTDLTPKMLYKSTQPKYFLLAILLQFGLFSLSFVNNAFVEFLNGIFGYSGSVSVPNLEGAGLFFSIIVIALIPAFMEESIFRGILLSPLKNFSVPFAVLVCGGLFALFHQNPAQTVYQFICGCLFALVAIRSGSILPTMLAHFLNNAVILILTATGADNALYEGPFSVVFNVISAVALAFSIVYFIFLDKNGNELKGQGDKKQFFLFASVGIAVSAVLWIAQLFGA